MNSNRKTLLFIGAVIIAVIVLAIVFSNVGTVTPEISYSDLIKGIQLQEGEEGYPIISYRCYICQRL
jgi:hypothetical protein